MKEFEVKEYGRCELVSLYSPDIEPLSAWKKLKGWIQKSPHLMDNLRASGYDSSQRSFTPQQVRLIVNALGEP